MATSASATVSGYLDELPPERRAVVDAVRKRVARAMPKGFEETMASGMIAWVVPSSRYPKTYNKQPLAYVALAAQKNGYSLYLTGPYMDPARDAALRAAYAKAGRKLDMGKSCLRFKSLDELELDAIAAVIASMPVDDFIAFYEKSRA